MTDPDERARLPLTRITLLRVVIAIMVGGSIILGDCFSCDRFIETPPPWPIAGAGDLEIEIEATRRKLVEVPEPDATPPEELPGDRPDIQARDGTFAGIYYVEVVVGDVPIDAELPMLVLIHGRGDRPRIPGGPFAGVQRPLRIILPRGPDPLGDGFSWIPVRTAEMKIDEMTMGLSEMAGRIASLIDDLRARRATWGGPIVVGFSQGGLLTFTLAVHHPDVVDRAFPLAGWLPPPLVPDSLEPGIRYPPIRAIHGASDDIVPIEPTRLLVSDLFALGLDIELVEFEGVGHYMSEDMNARFSRWLRSAVDDVAPIDPPWVPPPPDAGVPDGGPVDAASQEGGAQQPERERQDRDDDDAADDGGRPAEPLQ